MAPLQLPVQRGLVGRRRATALAAALGTIGIAWTLVLVIPESGTLLLIAVGVVFAVAETLFTPVVPALVNDLAPELTRGRYNGAQAAAWTGGWLLGAAAGAALIAAGPQAARALFAASILLLGFGMAASFKLHRSLPSHLARVPSATGPEPGPETSLRAPAPVET
ncbi:MFS transporter [Streptomyces sp. NPDC057909]|uniref:MFS transporter n=1 Tax=Streptomyces sp. NPDC057909 TaxID=3346277 RepID=UPI0036EEA726